MIFILTSPPPNGPGPNGQGPKGPMGPRAQGPRTQWGGARGGPRGSQAPPGRTAARAPGPAGPPPDKIVFLSGAEQGPPPRQENLHLPPEEDLLLGRSRAPLKGKIGESRKMGNKWISDGTHFRRKIGKPIYKLLRKSA